MLLHRKKYKSGKIKIVSNVNLTEIQVEKIFNIVNEVMFQGLYEPCYQVSRAIYYALKPELGADISVETFYTRLKYLKIKISIK